MRRGAVSIGHNSSEGLESTHDTRVYGNVHTTSMSTGSGEEREDDLFRTLSDLPVESPEPKPLQ